MFHVGQVVECIDASINRDWGITPRLKKGCRYTVTELSSYADRDGDWGIRVSETDAQVPSGYFKASRFRPVVEKKTDISVFEEILKRETVDDPLTVAKIVDAAERMFSRYSNR